MFKRANYKKSGAESNQQLKKFGGGNFTNDAATD